MNFTEALEFAARRLADSGVPDARKDATLLLAFATGRDTVFIRAHSETELSGEDAETFTASIARRCGREPIQYIIGRQEFYGLDFEVTPDVLIPRPETEFLVESAIKILGEKENPRFCEIGVGAGCISISVLHEIPLATAVAGDVSKRALAVAEKNATRHDVTSRLELLVSDVFEGVTPERFDAVLSNPPYVPISDLASLQTEVRDFEPIIALVGGADGLSIVTRIVDGAPERLVPSGRLLMEIGFGQAEKVRRLFDGEMWRSIELLADLQGIPRVLAAERL